MKTHLVPFLIAYLTASALPAHENELDIIMSDEVQYRLDFDLKVMKNELSILNKAFEKLNENLKDIVKDKSLEKFDLQFQNLQLKIAGFLDFKNDIQFLKQKMTLLSEALVSSKVRDSTTQQTKGSQKAAWETSKKAQEMAPLSADMQSEDAVPSLQNSCCYVQQSCCEKPPFIMSADFIYWRAENQGNSFTYEQTDPKFGTGHLFTIPASWDPGFRVGIGWNTPTDCWDIFLNWTCYHNKAKTHKTTEITAASQGFWPLWMGSKDTTFGPFAVASANWRLHNNDIDLEMGRTLNLTKTLSIRPHMGVRAGWLHQKFNNHFSSVSPFSTEVTQIRIFRKSNFWGVGPRAGFNTEWNWVHGFGVLGKFSGAFLYGKSNMRITPQSIHLVEFGDLEFHNLRDITQNFTELLPTMQWMLGLEWGSLLGSNDQFYLNFNLCWETNYWWVQSSFPVIFSDRSSPSPPSGTQSVSMEGITFNAVFDF